MSDDLTTDPFMRTEVKCTEGPEPGMLTCTLSAYPMTPEERAERAALYTAILFDDLSVLEATTITPELVDEISRMVAAYRLTMDLASLSEDATDDGTMCLNRKQDCTVWASETACVAMVEIASLRNENWVE